MLGSSGRSGSRRDVHDGQRQGRSPAAEARRPEPRLPGASAASGGTVSRTAAARRRAERPRERTEHRADEPRRLGPGLSRVLARAARRCLADNPDCEVARLAAHERFDELGWGCTFPVHDPGPHLFARRRRATPLTAAGRPRSDERAAPELDAREGRRSERCRFLDRSRHQGLWSPGRMKIDMDTIMKRVKALHPGALIGMMVGAVLVFGLAGWFLLVRPQGANVTSLKKQATEVQAKIDAYHQQVAAARAAPKIEVADVYRLAKAMPDRTDMPDLLLELSQLARDTGLRFDSISPQTIAPIGTYTVLPISVTFQGNFYNLADFLYRLRSLVSVQAGRLDATGRLFSVDTLTFNESTLKFPQIQATLVIDAFVYGTGVPATAPIPTTPTTPTTAATTTTTTETAPS